MQVSKERLATIGKFIGVYREEKRGKTQNKYTLKSFCDGICSVNTLKNIESGELSRSIDVYNELLSKFDLKLGEFTIIDDALHILMKTLYEAIEVFDYEQIKSTLIKIIKLLIKVKDFVFYSELYLMFSELYEYYVNNKNFSDHEIQYFLNIFDYMEGIYKDVLRLLIFSKLRVSYVTNIDEYIKRMEKIKVEEADHYCVKFAKLHYFLITKKYQSMSNLLIEMESYYETTNNYVSLLDVYNFAFILYSYIDTEYIEIYVEKVRKLTKAHVLPNIKISEIYSNIASSYHNRAQYAKALHYYEQALSFYRGDLVRQGILIADCQNRLGKDIDIPYVDDEEFQEYPLSLKLMYKYFCLEKEVPIHVRQMYIMKKLLPYLTDEVCIGIFQYELSKLVEKTNNYKLLYEFDREVRKHAN